MNRKKKGKYIGMAGALVVHVAIIALLILVGFTPPEPSEEGGVPVMLGEVPDALGAADPSLVKVDVMPEETAPAFPVGMTTLSFIFSRWSKTAFRYSASALTMSFISLLRCLIFNLEVCGIHLPIHRDRII